MKDSSEAVVTIIAQIFLTAKIFNAFFTVKKVAYNSNPFINHFF